MAVSEKAACFRCGCVDAPKRVWDDKAPAGFRIKAACVPCWAIVPNWRRMGERRG